MKSFFATKRTSSRGPHLWMWSGKHRATHRFALGMVAAWLLVWLMFTLQRGPVGAPPSLAQQQPNQPQLQGHQGTEVKKQGHSWKDDELSAEPEISPSPNSPHTQTDTTDNQQSFLQHKEQGSIELEQRLRDLKDIIEKRRAKLAGRQEQELGTVVDRSAPGRILKRNKAETEAEETFTEWFKRESGKELTEFNSYPTSQELMERAQLKLKDKQYGRTKENEKEEESYYVDNSREESQDHEKNNVEHEQQKAENEGADFEEPGNGIHYREDRDGSEAGQAKVPLGLATPEEEEYEVLFPKPSLLVVSHYHSDFNLAMAGNRSRKVKEETGASGLGGRFSDEACAYS